MLIAFYRYIFRAVTYRHGSKGKLFHDSGSYHFNFEWTLNTCSFLECSPLILYNLLRKYGLQNTSLSMSCSSDILWMNPATYRSSGSPISLIAVVSIILLPEILGELSEIILGSALNTIVVVNKFTLEIGIKRLSNCGHHFHAKVICHLPSV